MPRYIVILFMCLLILLVIDQDKRGQPIAGLAATLANPIIIFGPTFTVNSGCK